MILAEMLEVISMYVRTIIYCIGQNKTCMEGKFTIKIENSTLIMNTGILTKLI